MGSHSDLPHLVTHRLHTSSSSPPLRAPTTWTDTLQYLEADSRKITSSLQTKRVKISAQSQSQRRTNYATAIDLLPDELLLDIFDHIRHAKISPGCRHNPVTSWQVLVHVCRRWRQIVFASTRRLDLKLLCTDGTPVREYLACWPAFPIVVEYDCEGDSTPNVEDDIVAALEHHNRISHIDIAELSSSVWRKMATVMREPFPALTSCSIMTANGNVPSIPSGFLGSAPCLRKIRFSGIPIPALPTLLPYKSNLVELDLSDWATPRTDFILPAALVAHLAMLPSLEVLNISLPTWTSQHYHWQLDLPPKTRVVLPVLTSFCFNSERTYLEDFVAQIDTPRLDVIDITIRDLLDSRIPQISAFLNRSGLKPSRFEDAKICFDNRDMVSIDLNHELDRIPFSIHISSWEGINHKVWCMAQVLRQISGMLSNVGRLEIGTVYCWWIEEDGEDEEEEEDMGDIDWLELLRPFTAVETLHVCEKFGKSIARALEGMPAETNNQVLPALNLLSLEGEPTTSIDHLFPALQGRGRPLTITIQRPRFVW